LEQWVFAIRVFLALGPFVAAIVWGVVKAYQAAPGFVIAMVIVLAWFLNTVTVLAEMDK